MAKTQAINIPEVSSFFDHWNELKTDEEKLLFYKQWGNSVPKKIHVEGYKHISKEMVKILTDPKNAHLCKPTKRIPFDQTKILFWKERVQNLFAVYEGSDLADD